MTFTPPGPYHELRPYQEQGVKFLSEQGRAFLADEMGLGKSAQLIRAAGDGATLIVAPAMVIDSGTWTNETERWSLVGPDYYQQATYSNLTVREKTGNGHATRPTNELLPELDRHWDTLILDEAHYVKNGKAFRTKAIQKLARQADQVFLASGTPIPSWPHELFVPLQLLFPEKGKPGGEFGSKWRWTDEWFRTAPNRFSDSAYAYDVLGLRGCGPACQLRSPLDPCEHYRRFVESNLGPKFLQRLRDDVLTDLPPLTEQVVRLPMTAKQDREYASMAKDYLATVEDQEVIAWSTAAKNTFLDKMTTGLGVAQGQDFTNSAKFDQLAEDLAERFRPTLVVAHYKNTVEAAAKLSRKLGKRTELIHGGTRPQVRQQVVRDFQAGKVDVLVGSLDTVSEGLTLTAADMLIQLETSYKPSRNQQVKRRIHRLGQQLPCTVREYVVTRRSGARCLDENKRELVATKTDAQTRTLSAARFKELL